MRPRLLQTRRFLHLLVVRTWRDFKYSRGAAKYATFYLVSAGVFLTHALLTLRLYYALLDTDEENPYFDFRATSPESPTSGVKFGCNVENVSPFALWLGPSRVLANYVTLVKLVSYCSVTAQVVAAAALLASLSFRRFRSMTRARLASPTRLDQFIGIICKLAPRVYRLCLLLLVITAVVLATLLMCFGVCTTKIVEVSRPINRIRNCRSWVRHCVHDTRQFGRHLQCSLPENFEAFPAETCGSDQSIPCLFPVTHAGSSRRPERRGGGRKREAKADAAPTAVELHDDICEGEKIADEDGGPVPWCPMCTEARRDSPSGVFDKSIGMDGRRYRGPTARSSRRGATSNFAQLGAAPTSVADDSEEKRQPDVGSKSRPPKRKTRSDGIPIRWRTFKDQNEAFYRAYMHALSFFGEGSDVSRALTVWLILTLCLLLCHELAHRALHRLVPHEGHLIMDSPLMNVIDFARNSLKQLVSVLLFWRKPPEKTA